MLDNAKPYTHHQGLPFGLTVSCVFEPASRTELFKALVQGREGHENHVVYQGRQEDSFQSSLPSQNHSAGSEPTRQDVAVPREEWDAGALPASFFCLLTMSLLTHHGSQKVSQGEASGSSAVTLSFPTFSKVWGIVLAPLGMGASRRSDVVGTVGWAGAKFFKGKRKSNIGSFQLVGDRGSE